MLLTLASIFTSIKCIGALSPVVKLGDTDIIGREFGSSIRTDFFGGIPFAKPPLGQLRLNFPVLLPALEVKKFDAATFGPGCLQNPLPPSGASEDCLTLDVYRPSGVSVDAKLPVLVWLYGVGASSFYNGTSLVARSVSRGTPILFVSVNYRVGPLGFPQGNEAGQNKLLNLGLHDQLVALEWIQRSIHNFGGDKTKVTVSGESAGAASISIHFLQPRIKTLARAFIMESGGTLAEFGPEKNEANWQQYVSAIPECAGSVGTNNTFDCIRKSDSASLEQALVDTHVGFANASFRPIIDGPGGLLVDRPSLIVPQGLLPTLFGTNVDEGTLTTLQSTNSTEDIRDFLLGQFNPPIVSPQKLDDTIEKLLNLYPDVPPVGSPFNTGNDTFGLNSQYKRLSAIMGDFFMQSCRRQFSQNISAAGLPVFAYYFADGDAVAFPEFAPSPMPLNPKSLGVTHTSELPYVFGTLINKTPSAVALSAIMQDYWISFVNALDPNDNRGNKRPQWGRYTLDNRVLLKLDGHHTSIIPDNFRERSIAAWLETPDVFHR